ncbi:uncharacterized protein AMSG_04986 [Thecamonas trahens ATCC 50062]|uniref:C2HC/C3H-type domain-containing protein n=1 Tax=Thecamonas trahens ATCC 50062 TaxID=461836 RepID=A0A0L0D8Z7_THETB|nr:hypothetical protein AMSG_04986 [Thecamonas trahens ATCC 50062]KNC48541.1 hypothetical protein AMSG_04986 [Thecamonas trahens ATCC 50062]|eukprot:XP_013758648.1 hypothetical protein AMSG_04986 [Thecamonas trahens ATCC 50062]
MGCGASKSSASDTAPQQKRKKGKRTPLPSQTVAGPESGLDPAKIEEGLPPPDYVPPNLVECPICERKFAEDRIAKHKKACKAANKERRAFDTKRMRQERDARKAEAASDFDDSVLDENRGKWREQHEDFIRKVRRDKAGSASNTPQKGTKRPPQKRGRAPRRR